MFELPAGTPYESEINISEGGHVSFSHGLITTWSQHHNEAFGHRLVRSGRVVAWCCSVTDGVLIVGHEAKEKLELFERLEPFTQTASTYTLNQLGAVAEIIPEAFVNQLDRQGLSKQVNYVERMLSLDLSHVIQRLCDLPEVRGAMALDAGLVIDTSGKLPMEADELAISIQNLSPVLDAHQFMPHAQNGPSHWTIQTADGSMLIAQSNSITLTVWTESETNHGHLLASIGLQLEGQHAAVGEGGSQLPNGFMLREGKSGTDAVLSMLKDAKKEGVTGHLQSGVSSKAVSIMLSKGIPISLHSPAFETIEDALDALCDAKRTLRLFRFEAGTIISSKSGTHDTFNLGALMRTLPSTRTRSEARKATISSALFDLYGFELGLEQASFARATYGLTIQSDQISEPLPVLKHEAIAAVDAGLRRQLEQTQEELSVIKHQYDLAQTKLKEAEVKREAAQIMAREASETRQSSTTNLESAHQQLNTMQVDLAEARAQASDAESRSERLVRRVNELEHQLSERAAQLAKAVGTSSSRAELQSMIEGLAKQEAELQANLKEGSERLESIRKQSDDEERRLRVLTEQVNTTRERHARAQAEILTIEEQIHVERLQIEGLKNEEQAVRQRSDSERQRLSHDEARKTEIHSELRELMDERRQLLRELGDLGAKRGHAEAELTTLLEKATTLATAHEEALGDIEEAKMLRARLSEEPLARVLLEDHNSFEGLGPVLDRLEHARSLGYSVNLLDRAVERALQVIQATVDHVASTPRQLLSSEVMTLLERQVPQTAGAVRGLAKWSVQQRLEEHLGETVTQVIIDLEHLLEDYDRSVTMLRRIRNVLDQLQRLGAPEQEIHALLANCQRPEALPSLAQGTRRLIQIALDDIYLEADQRDAGEAIALEDTARVLEELITQLDSTGLTDGIPKGMLWEFQRDGYLPFERNTIPNDQRIPVSPDTMIGTQSTLLHDEDLVMANVEPTVVLDDEGWSEMSSPLDDHSSLEVETPISRPASTHPTLMLNAIDERATLEAELARLDAARTQRHQPTPQSTGTGDAALDSLEARLANLDF